MDEARRRAREGLPAGAERAGARAHFRAMGIDPARLGEPIVGVVSSWTQTMPCNLTHRELAAAAAEGVEDAVGARSRTRWPGSPRAAARRTGSCTCSRSRARAAWSSRSTS